MVAPRLAYTLLCDCHCRCDRVWIQRRTHHACLCVGACSGATCNKALACGTTATTYTFQMYQKMDKSGNWDLRGRVEISGDGPTTISYYKTV